MIRPLLLALVLAAPAHAQTQPYSAAEGASLRFLDKLTSETGDVTIGVGQVAQFGRLMVRLDECRYPTDDPTSDSEAHLTVVEATTQQPLFFGWMLASAPALSALDHPRYDVWVLACVLPEAPAEEAPASE